MEEPENKDLGGRPRKDVDIEKLRTAVSIQCTAEECAALLDCSTDTIDRRLKELGYEGFAEFYKKHSSSGKASLRRMQWQAANAGNVTMLIWLGKQMLDQRDKQDTNLSGEVTISKIEREIVDPEN